MEPVPCKRIRLEASVDDQDESLQRSESDHPTDSVAESDWLTEMDVGIRAFVNPDVPGFDCTLKTRWEDFMVQEISQGSCAELTNIDSVDFDLDHVPKPDTSLTITVLEPHRNKLESLLNRQCDQIELAAPASKDARTELHKAIRTIYPELDSRTVNSDTRQIIVVNRANKLPTFRLPKNQAYCRFVLYKEGKDTISAIQLLSRLLHIRPGSFAYAGTKDRRAITTQFVTLKGIDSRRLSALNQKLRGIRLGNFSYVPKPLFLGDLDGNRFTVVLRSVEASDSIVREGIEAWQRDGFVNYYGLQRFGHSTKARSFDTGRYIIQSDWESAILHILLPTKADLPCVQQLKRDFMENRNAKQSADRGPPCIERELLWGVAKHGFKPEALQSLPRNLRQLYVHSYQSLVWNRIATRRICELPPNANQCLHVVAGDLYLPSAASLDCEPTDDFPTELELIDHVQPTDARQMTNRHTLPCPKVATEADCSSIPITDLILPLPGFAVRYPENKSGQWYHEMLKEDGLTVDDFRHQVKDFALPGSYRALVVKPKDVSFTIREYTDSSVPLIESDLKRLEQSTGNKSSTSNLSTLDSQLKQHSDSGKSERAVVLQFTLPKSSYATIAIRELTKSFTEKR
ncbi:tRNA pseudouridine synthase D [Fasciolopsis buskii]|uniref:tRNA pseudouridine synthase D n=1 Tax=Fasciolopsis buskii TaxID=27845 RepID=A0A8E0RQ08_9TREM|nr:tRNA pseudouridine synthase D [Fasciolopsis buski]